MIQDSACRPFALDDRPCSMALFRPASPERLLCLVPSLRALKSFLPHSTLTLIGLPEAKPFVQRFNFYIDNFIEFPGYPGLTKNQTSGRNFARFLAAIQSRRFDVAFQMQGDGPLANSAAVLLGAKQTFGFYRPGDYCPDLATFVPSSHFASEVDQWLRLLHLLGIPSRGRNLEFPISANDEREFLGNNEAAGLRTGRIVCFHLGEKAIDSLLGKFSKVGDAVASWGYDVALTGPKERLESSLRLARKMRFPATNLTGKTSLGSLGFLISRSKLLITDNAEVDFLASALRVPPLLVQSSHDDLLSRAEAILFRPEKRREVRIEPPSPPVAMENRRLRVAVGQ